MSDMSTKISLRLSDDVLQAVDHAASREGRNRTQQIEWVLKIGLNMYGPPAGISRETWEGTMVPKSATKANLGNVPGLETEKILEKLRYRKCTHGDNEYTCQKNSCRIKTGRL